MARREETLVQETRRKRTELAARADGGSILASVRIYCLACCGGSGAEVVACPSAECPLYPYRTGRNTLRAVREMTEEQRTAAAERLAAARVARKEG